MSFETKIYKNLGKDPLNVIVHGGVNLPGS